MFLFDEKRKLKDRRVADTGVPAGRRERRVEADRRQTRICEITFSEWASYLVAFRKDAVTREAVAKAPSYPDVPRTAGINPRLSPNR